MYIAVVFVQYLGYDGMLRPIQKEFKIMQAFYALNSSTFETLDEAILVAYGLAERVKCRATCRNLRVDGAAAVMEFEYEGIEFVVKIYEMKEALEEI